MEAIKSVRAFPLTAALVLGLTVPARADDLASIFGDVCVSAHGDEAAATAKIKQMGWTERPIFPAKSDDRLINTAHFEKRDATNLYIFTFGHYENEAGDQSPAAHYLKMFCSVAAQHPTAELAERLSPFVGLSGTKLESKRGYYFREEGGSPIPLDITTGDRRILNGGPMFALTYGVNSDETHIVMVSFLPQ